MIGRIRNTLGIKFWIRIATCFTIVVSAHFFTIIVNPLLKVFIASTFFLSLAFFALCYAPQFFDRFQLLSTHKRAVEISVPSDIADLAKRMGVKLKKIKVKEGMCNAYAAGNTLVMGSYVMNDFTSGPRCAVAAHELGHIKENHDLISYLAINVFVAFAFFNWLKLPIPMLFAATLAYSVVVVTLINWYLETRADNLAAKYAGKENVKLALLIIAQANGRDLNEPSEFHPSIARRIKRLEKVQ